MGEKPGQVKIQGTARNLPRAYQKDNENTKKVSAKRPATCNTDEDTEKIGSRSFLHSRKVPGLDSPECLCRRGLQSAKHVLLECRAHAGKRNRMWEKDRRKAAFRRIDLEMLIRPKSAQEAAQIHEVHLD